MGAHSSITLVWHYTGFTFQIMLQWNIFSSFLFLPLLVIFTGSQLSKEIYFLNCLFSCFIEITINLPYTRFMEKKWRMERQQVALLNHTHTHTHTHAVLKFMEKSRKQDIMKTLWAVVLKTVRHTHFIRDFSFLKHWRKREAHEMASSSSFGATVK
jgi:hypothetical protein